MHKSLGYHDVKNGWLSKEVFVQNKIVDVSKAQLQIKSNEKMRNGLSASSSSDEEDVGLADLINTASMDKMLYQVHIDIQKAVQKARRFTDGDSFHKLMI